MDPVWYLRYPAYELFLTSEHLSFVIIIVGSVSAKCVPAQCLSETHRISGLFNSSSLLFPFSLSFSLVLCIFLSLSVCLSVCVCVSVSLYVCLARMSVCLSVCMSTCLHAFCLCLSVCLCLCLSLPPFFFPSSHCVLIFDCFQSCKKLFLENIFFTTNAFCSSIKHTQAASVIDVITLAHITLAHNNCYNHRALYLWAPLKECANHHAANS